MTIPDQELYAHKIIEMFDESLDEWGDTDDAKAVRWVSAARQKRLYHSLMMDAAYLPGMTFCDVGCGLGGLLNLGLSMLTPETYLGLDITPRMVEGARKRHPGFRFEIGDAVQQDERMKTDWIISSGVLGIMDPDAQLYAIKNLYEHAKIGVAFNTTVNYEKEENSNAIPIPSILAFIETLTTRYVVRHDCLPHIVSFVMYKQTAPTWA